MLYYSILYYYYTITILYYTDIDGTSRWPVLTEFATAVSHDPGTLPMVREPGVIRSVFWKHKKTTGYMMLHAIWVQQTMHILSELPPQLKMGMDQNWSQNLVGGAITILKNISQWEGLSHTLWKIKHVPNHQPDICSRSQSDATDGVLSSLKTNYHTYPLEITHGNDKSHGRNCMCIYIYIANLRYLVKTSNF